MKIKVDYGIGKNTNYTTVASTLHIIADIASKMSGENITLGKMTIYANFYTEDGLPIDIGNEKGDLEFVLRPKPYRRLPKDYTLAHEFTSTDKETGEVVIIGYGYWHLIKD